MKSKKALIIAILVLAVAAAAVLAFTMKPAEEAEHDYFLVNQGDKVLVMDAFNPEEVVAEFENISMNNIVYCSKDSSSFILRENDNDDYPCLFDLVVYNVASGKKTLVDSNVTDYVVTEDFKTFVYVKENDSKLYKKSLADSEASVITESARRFYMTDNGGTIIFEDYEDKTYLKNGNAEAVLLGENVTIKHFERSNGDFVYSTGTKLVVHKGGKDTVVTESLYTGDSAGHIGSCDNFYFTETQKEFTALDLFEDDLDEALKNSKDEADSLREVIAEFFNEDYYNYTLRKVFYYDNGSISEVCDNVVDVFNCYSTSPVDKVAGVFITYDLENKIKLSDFYGSREAAEIDGVYCYQFNALKKTNIVKKDTVVHTLESKNMLGCKYNYNSDEMYFAISDNTDFPYLDTPISDICKMSLKEGSDEIITIDSGKCFILTTAAVIEKELHYYTFEENGYSLYKNGEAIIENADDMYEITEDIFYFSATEDNKETVKIYFDGEIHEYPEIDFTNRYAYTTDNDNIIVWKNDGKYFYLINSDSVVRIDEEFEIINTFLGETNEFAYNEYVAE